jgi:DNA topoisomerase-3
VNPELSAVIDGADPRRKSPAWNDAKTTAHHAIIPTQHTGDTRGLSETERRIYGLVVRRYLAQFFPDHEFAQTTVDLDMAGHGFRATGKTVQVTGWKQLDAHSNSDDENEEDKHKGGRTKDEDAPKDQALPAMALQDAVQCVSANRKDCKTKPPARFTEGSLVRAMEQIHKWINDPEQKKWLREGDGLGTSATRAGILGDLRRRQFLTTSGKHLLSTALGRALVDALPDAVKSAALTAVYERMLQQIESGQADPISFLRRQARFVAERVAAANEGAMTVPAALTRCARDKSATRPRRARTARAQSKAARHPTENRR